MAVATITKKSDGFYVTTRIKGQKHLLRVCPKHITAAQIKQEVDSGRYVLPAPVLYQRIKASAPIENGFKEKIENGFKEKIFAWLQENQTMWTTVEIAKVHGVASTLVTGAIHALQTQGKICRGSNQTFYTYGILDVIPVVEDFKQAILDTLKQNPQGVFQRELAMRMECHIPTNFQEVLNDLVASGVVKTETARRLHTKSRSFGRRYHV